MSLQGHRDQSEARCFLSVDSVDGSDRDTLVAFILENYKSMIDQLTVAAAVTATRRSFVEVLQVTVKYIVPPLAVPRLLEDEEFPFLAIMLTNPAAAPSMLSKYAKMLEVEGGRASMKANPLLLEKLYIVCAVVVAESVPLRLFRIPL